LAEADFSLLQNIQIESGAQMVSCLIGTGGGSSLGHEPDHSSPCSAEVKNEWSYTLLAPFAYVAYTFFVLTWQFCLDINPVRLM